MLAVEVVIDLIHHGAKLIDDKGNGAMSILLEDPILYKLIRKAVHFPRQTGVSSKIGKAHDFRYSMIRLLSKRLVN